MDGHLYSYLSKIKKNNDVIDIEKVLWAINKLWEDFHKCTNANTVTGHVVSENYPDFWKFVVQSNTSLEGLANRIHEQVYKIYSKIPGDSHIEDLATFLCNIQGFYPAIEIFTTNYDLVLDRIIEQYNINVELGHKRGDVGMTILDMAAWHHPGELLKGDLGRLTKLHGSVNWKRENGNVVVGSTHYTGDDRNHPILYPGFKGEPTREPFASFHKHLEKVARKARAAIFIGFSFRDEYINRILRGVPKEAPKYIINKKELQVDTLPFGFPFDKVPTFRTVQDLMKL